MIAIGIDNGTSGAVAVIRFEPQTPPVVEELIKMPVYEIGKDQFIDESELMNLLVKYQERNCIVGFEIGQKQPLFGTKGNFANGYSYGVVRTVVRLSHIPHLEVNPRTWQKEILKDIKNADVSTKDASIEFCRRTFPNETLLVRGSKKKNDGLADAICIASYVARKLTQ